MHSGSPSDPSEHLEKEKQTFGFPKFETFPAHNQNSSLLSALMQIGMFSSYLIKHVVVQKPKDGKISSPFPPSWL